MPSLAFIGCDVETRLRSYKEQLWIDMVLHDGECWRSVREVSRDRLPCLALIGALHDIWLVVTIFVVVKKCIDGVCRMPGCQYPANVRPFRDTRDLVQLPPGLAAIRGDVNKPIIRAGVDKAFFFWRFINGNDVAVKRCRLAAGDGIELLRLAHDLEVVAVDLFGEIAAHSRPRVATVIRAEQNVRSVPETLRIMRADQQRGVPVKTQRRRALCRKRCNARARAGLAVEAHKAAILGFGVNNIRIARLNRLVEAIPARGYKPLRRANAAGALGAAWTTDAVVVLCPAVDVVKRLTVIDGDPVKLRNREVGFEYPSGATVEGFVNTAITARKHMPRVARINPECVVVDVLVTFADIGGRPAAIVTDLV